MGATLIVDDPELALVLFVTHSVTPEAQGDMKICWYDLLGESNLGYPRL